MKNAHPEHDHPEGLLPDLVKIAELERRRRALRTLAGFGALSAAPLMALAAPGGSRSGLAGGTPGGGRTSPGTGTGTGTGTSTGSGTTTTSSGSCTTIPSETAGPYPGDGTNSNSSGLVNVLTQSGIVRNDIRSSFGSMSGTAAGVPLTVTLQLANVASACTTLNGYAVYMWHCDRDGNYSLYTVPAQNYLRGVWVTDSLGSVTFTTIFPGCYSGRWPHIHFEVYSSLGVATTGVNDIKTSQLALPAAACSAVYTGASGYSSSVSNLSKLSLASDNVFSNDSAKYQLATVTGSVSQGFAATLTVGI